MSARNDNAAQRLHDILQQLSKFGDSQPVYAAWAEVLGVDTDDAALAFDAYARLLELPQQVADRLVAMPNVNADLYLRWRPQVDRALQSMRAFTSPIGNVKKHYDKTTLLGLEYAAHMLTQAQPCATPDEAALGDLLSKLHEVHAEVLAAGLPPQMKAWILRQLGEMERAILLFPVTGVEGMVDAYADACVVVDVADKVAPETDGKRRPSAWRRFVDGCNDFRSVLATARDGYEIAGPVFEQITGSM